MAPGMLCWLSQLRTATENDRVEVVSRVSGRTVMGDQWGGVGGTGRWVSKTAPRRIPEVLAMLIRTWVLHVINSTVLDGYSELREPPRHTRSIRMHVVSYPYGTIPVAQECLRRL